MMNDNNIRFNEYLVDANNRPVENVTERHMLILILLDLSGSMYPYTQELQRALRSLIEQLKNNAATRGSCEICLVACSGEKPDVLLHFGPLRHVELPVIMCQGRTPLHAAIHLGLDQLEARFEELKAVKCPQYVPFCFVLSDGAPTDTNNGAVERLVQKQKDKRVLVYPIGVGPYAEKNGKSFLSSLQAAHIVWTGNYQQISEFFEFIAASTKIVLGTKPGNEIRLLKPDEGGFNFNKSNVPYSDMIID